MNLCELLFIEAGSIDPQEIHEKWFLYPMAYGAVEVFEFDV